jgi:hypothetical protein
MPNFPERADGDEAGQIDPGRKEEDPEAELP